MYLIAITVQVCIIYVIQSVSETTNQGCENFCPSGVPGNPGNDGIPGLPGPNGLQGYRGAEGDRGSQGTNGKQYGNRGIKGPKGGMGLKGEYADHVRGEPGFPGPKGDKGERGSALTRPHTSAFSVSFTVDLGRHPISPMKYETVNTNIGSDYSTETGKFVCEYPGTYVFQVSGLKSSGNGKAVLTKIMKNGIGTVSSRMDAEGYSSSSNMVVLNLVAGDEVWTEPFSASYNYYYSSVHAYCSFSGFLLSAHT